MERISVFDMFKIGVGPSSSHTLGPWKAAGMWVSEVTQGVGLDQVQSIKVYLYGSLALTGKGHATDMAIIMGLTGEDPEKVEAGAIAQKIAEIKEKGQISLGNSQLVKFNPSEDLVFLYKEKLPFHANALKFEALTKNGKIEGVYYSIGGGFVVKEGEGHASGTGISLPYPCDNAGELKSLCSKHRFKVSDLVLENECCWQSEAKVKEGLANIWHIMESAVYKGCHTPGKLPGGLDVLRRASGMHQKLIGKNSTYQNTAEWIQKIKSGKYAFDKVLNWISCFAMAVNEENAAMGRVVTAPTNGAAGVIPAVIMYYFCFRHRKATLEEIIRFLLVAGEIGTYFKRGATISAAMGGCQAEIGVSSAMAAAGLTECLGGTVDQVLMSAEIAMEHHLGLTCDPVGGLVQIPCIERNSMGAIKAITASKIALESDPQHAKVSLDKVIQTMWDTAKDMDHKYKETSEGGLAANIPVNLPEC